MHFPPCFHCGLESHPDFSAPLNNISQPFCCIGCQAVAQTIAGAGLNDFYRFRTELNSRAKPNKLNYVAFDDPDVQREFVSPLADGELKQANLIITNLS